MEHEWHKMAKKRAVRMRDPTFSKLHLISVIFFLQIFESAYNACGIYESVVMGLLKHSLTGPVE